MITNNKSLKSPQKLIGHKMHIPKLSIILPVYNGEKFVSNAINSIINQTFTDFELIIIDDGSKDGTYNLLKGFQKKDCRIQVISRENKGLIATLNEGFSIARGEYIARQDDDDISHRTRFEKQVRFLDESPEYALCGTFYNVVDEKNKFIRKHFLPSSNENIQQHLFDSCFGHGTIMLRKSMISDMLWYRAEALYVEDYDFFIRVAKKFKVYNIPEYLYDWCFRGESVSFENYKAQRTNKIAIQMSHEQNLEFLDAQDKAFKSYTEAQYLENLATVYLLENKRIKSISCYLKSLSKEFSIKKFCKLILALISRKLWIKSMERMRTNRYTEY